MYNVNEKPPVAESVFYGLQHLLACFGATVLVPLLVGIDPSRAIFSAGIGTLAYLLITGFKVPNFVGSSFAFIAVGVIACKQGEQYLAIGALASALTYVIISLIVAKAGRDWIKKILPPVVSGSVVAVIGLSLAGTAVNQAFKNAGGAFSPPALLIAAATLVIMFCAMYSKKRFLSSIAMLIGIAAGYLITALLGIIFPEIFGQFLDLARVKESASHPFSAPHFVFFWRDVNMNTALVVAAAFAITSFATICEHIGHTLVTGEVVGRDFIRDPGLHKTILGDGVATGLAGLFGSVCNTTYGESIGVMAMTKVYSVSVLVWSSMFAIVLSMLTPFSALIQSFPQPVLGGACMLLFGTIAANGFKQMVTSNVNLDSTRNLIIVSLTFITGVGGAVIPVVFGGTSLDLLSPIAVSALVGIVLNAVLPAKTESAK